MSEKRKPLPVCETENGVEGQLCMDGFPSGSDYSKKRTSGQAFSIVDYLHHDPTQPVTQDELAKATGLDKRTVRILLRKAVLEDRAAIVSDNSRGYWIASSEAERAACVQSLRGRAKEIAARADALEVAEVIGCMQ